MEILSLKFKSENGEENCKSLKLIENYGIDGDKKANGGERQICFADDNAVKKYKALGKGLCVKRFMPNVTTSGLDYSNLKAGDQIQFGTAIVEVSNYKKTCFEECPFVINKSKCEIQGNCAFGKIVKSGTVEKN